MTSENRRMWRKGITSFLLFTLLGVLLPTQLQAQRIALKTNALYWMTLSPNLSGEVRLSKHVTLDADVVGNFSTISGKQLHFFGVQGEGRYWLTRAMARHFVGITSFIESHDLIFNNTKHYGDAWAAGFTYGYAWPFARRWNLEATIGLGVIHCRDFKYATTEERPDNPNNNKTLVAPIKAGISIVYILK